MSGQNWLLIFGAIAIGLAALLFLPTETTVPVPPVVSAGPDVGLRESCAVRLNGDGYDPNGGEIFFQWTATGGRGFFDDPTLPDPIYTAPSLCASTESVELVLSATNRDGMTSFDTAIAHICALDCRQATCSSLPSAHGVTIVDVGEAEACEAKCPTPNCAPYANAGEDMTVVEGQTIRLTCDGSDPDGDPVSFYWHAPKGHFADPTLLHPMFTAPMIDCEPEDICISFTVTDSQGLSTTDTMIVHVLNQNRPPRADAGEDMTVTEGRRVCLSGYGVDPDGDSVTVLWSAPYGRFDNPCSLASTYTAPAVECGDSLDVVLTLTIMDSHGASSSDQLSVHVLNVNRPPTAHAGPDIAVLEATTVRLTGSGTDPDGDPVTYFWSATDGDGHFDDPCSLQPLYRVPTVDCGSTRDVSLTLTVTDRNGASRSDSLLVRVIDNPEQPSAQCNILEVVEGETIRLRGAVSDQDGSHVTAYWQATSGHFSDPSVLNPYFTAPMLGSGEAERMVRVSLAATDSCGLSDGDEILVRVFKSNRDPIVDAGQDILLTSTRRVQLQAYTHDPDSDEVYVLWGIYQGCGTLDDRSSPNPILQFCPDAKVGDEVLLTVRAIDSDGGSATDAIRIRLYDPTCGVPCLPPNMPGNPGS